MKQEKIWDEQIRRSLMEFPKEEPPAGFTKNVMDAIAATKRPVRYTPVFSRGAWVLISFLAIGLLVLGYSTSEDSGILPISDLDVEFKALSELKWVIPEYAIDTQILGYAFLALSCLFSFQIVLLKRIWEKKQVWY